MLHLSVVCCRIWWAAVRHLSETYEIWNVLRRDHDLTRQRLSAQRWVSASSQSKSKGWGEATRYYIINCRLLHENSTEPHWALLLQCSAVMIDAWSLDQLSYMHWLDGCHLLLHSFSDPEFFEENLSTKTGTQIAISIRTLTAVHCLGYIFIPGQQAFLLYLETRTDSTFLGSRKAEWGSARGINVNLYRWQWQNIKIYTYL